MPIPSLPLTTTITYTMDALLSQLKGQGSPFSSPPPNPNSVEKLLDTIHLLSQATVLVAHQLQERHTPVKAKPHRETRLPTPPLTPKPSPVSTAKKTPSPKLPAPVLSWVPRAPEYYRLPSPNTTTSTHTSVTTPAKPIPRTPHTKKDRKPKSKRTKPSTQPQPNPSPKPLTTPTTPRPASPDQRGPVAPPTPSPTSGSVPTDQCEPPNPLPTPTPSTPAADTKAAEAERIKAKRRIAKANAKAAAAASAAPPKPTTPTPIPTPTPTHQDDEASIAPANHIVNFPHTYKDCPRLPECPAHEVRFAVSCQAYVERKRNGPLSPLYPQPRPYAGSEEFELRCERDTSWWPEIPSTRSSSPGSPADPYAFTPPNDGNEYL